MKTAAMVLGLVGGIIGVIIALVLAPFLLGYGGMTGGPLLVLIPLGAGICGIVGGAIARGTNAPASWLLMLVGAFAGFLLFSRTLWLVPAVILCAGAGLRIAAKEGASEEAA